jgi:hypothetical protein
MLSPGAENMFQPDTVVFLGIERVFDPVPLPPAAEDQRAHAIGRKHGEIGDVGVEAGRLGGPIEPQVQRSLLPLDHLPRHFPRRPAADLRLRSEGLAQGMGLAANGREWRLPRNTHISGRSRLR